MTLPAPSRSVRLFGAILCLLPSACRDAELQPTAADAFQSALAAAAGEITLPAGRIVIDQPLTIPPGARDLVIRGHEDGSTVEMSPAFLGKAAIVARDVSNLKLSGFTIAGHRGMPRPSDVYLPPSDVTFADFYDDNGIVITGAAGLTIEKLTLRQIRNFAVIASRSSDVLIEGLHVSSSGSLNSFGRNNTSGGILLEEGVERFTVRSCELRAVAGNAIWTHSNYGSPRNSDGLITENTIHDVARDAIQVGHATRVRVTGNRGSRIGYPLTWIDLEGQANPVAVDSAGDVDESHFVDNHFEDVNGHCIDLDGFHDGTVSENSCVNPKPSADYPYSTFGVLFNNSNIDMKPQNVKLSGNLFQGFAYGGVYLIGSGHRIVENQFLDLNRAHCTGDASVPGCQYAPEEPGALRTGIYLTERGVRPVVTRNNEIRNNTVTGFGMDRWCVAGGPGLNLSQNSISGNTCQSLP